MELGKNIAKIRKDNNLTQDELALKYFVTRQTISNWENGKSYPDLETLVKISDDFNISLDVLLKEDSKMVKEINRDIKSARKYKNILKYIIIFVSVIVFAFLIYTVMYFNFKKNTIDKFNDIALKYKFTNDGDGIYYLDYSDNIKCSIIKPFPKLFDFKLSYKNDKSLNCTIITGEDLKNINGDGSSRSGETQINWENNGKIVMSTFSCEDKSNFKSSLITSNGEECDYYSKIAQYIINDYANSNINFDEVSYKLKVNKDILKEVLDQCTNIYNDLYK